MIVIHILPSISRSKDNHIKFGQSIEFNDRNNFNQNLCREWGRETSFCFFKKLYMRKQVVRT